MTDPKPKCSDVTPVLVDLEQELPVTEDELDLVNAWLSDLIAELLSEVPEEAN